MASAAGSMKKDARPLLWSAMVAHALGFAFVTFGQSGVLSLLNESAPEVAIRAVIGTGAGLAMATLIHLFISGLLPPLIRDRMAHFRWNTPLSGGAAFSVHGRSDPRIDMAALEDAYGPFPDDREAQDRAFYQLYRKVDDTPGVLDGLRNYIAARDITVLSGLVGIVLPLAAVMSAPSTTAIGWYTLVLLSVYATSVCVTRQYGVRLVQNTLASVNVRLADSLPAPPRS